MRLAVPAGELINSVEKRHVPKKKIPSFSSGDTVRVTLRVPEGEKDRTQIFEGVVISCRGSGTRQMITVRKMSFGIGVERKFPLFSPFLTKIELVRRGKARRAKLLYLREKSGKAARLKAEYFVQEAEQEEADTAQAQPAAEGKAEPSAPQQAPAPEKKPEEAKPAAKADKKKKKTA